MSDRHGSFYAIVLGETPPIKAVVFDRENGIVGRDSGFMVAFSDAPSPKELDETEPGEESAVADLGCLLDDFPELASALDLAREHGEVGPDGAGGWVPLEDLG